MTDYKAEVEASGLSQRDWYRSIYLLSDHWKVLRTKALEVHGSRCAKCPATKRLDVHHLRYKNIYDVEVEDLQVLCRKCHDKEHEVAPTPKPSRAKKPKGPKKPKKQWPVPNKCEFEAMLPEHIQAVYRKHLNESPARTQMKKRVYACRNTIDFINKTKPDNPNELITIVKATLGGKKGRGCKMSIYQKQINRGLRDSMPDSVKPKNRRRKKRRNR